MNDEIKVIRGGSADLRRQLERDGKDVILYLAATHRLNDVNLAVLIPYAWSERRPFLCGISWVTPGSRELAPQARK